MKAKYNNLHYSDSVTRRGRRRLNFSSCSGGMAMSVPSEIIRVMSQSGSRTYSSLRSHCCDSEGSRGRSLSISRRTSSLYA